MTPLTGCKNILAVCVLMILSIFAPRTLCFVPLIAGVAGYAMLSWRRKSPVPLDKNLGIFLALIVALCALSYFWADLPHGVIDRSWNNFVILGLGFLLLSFVPFVKPPTRGAAIILLTTYGIAGLYFVIEYSFGFPIIRHFQADFQSYYMNRSMVVYTLLLFPMLFLARRAFTGWILPAALLALAAIPLNQTSSQTAQMIFASGLAAYLVLNLVQKPLIRHWMLTLFALGFVAGMMATPFIPHLLLQHQSNLESTNFAANANIGGRVEIWNFIASKIAEKPVLGHGVEATRYFHTDHMLEKINKTHSILHPHNGLLQIWVELGIPGALLACALIIFILVRVQKTHPENQPLYFAVLVAALSLLSTGYGLWQSWQLGLLLAISGVCLFVTRTSDPQKA